MDKSVFIFMATSWAVWQITQRIYALANFR